MRRVIRSFSCAALSAGLLLSGCATEGSKIAAQDVAEMSTTPDNELLWAYSRQRLLWGEQHALRAEIERRGLLTVEQWKLVDRGQNGQDLDRLVYARFQVQSLKEPAKEITK